MLRTQRRETLLVNACLEGKTPFVIDKMNLTVEKRAGYIAAAKGAGFRVIGYFFQSEFSAALERNSRRALEERIPEAGLRNAAGRLELPTRREGFDQLFLVRIDGPMSFTISEVICLMQSGDR